MRSTAISVSNVSKVYRIYERPEDRLIQMMTLGRVRRFTEFTALSGISLDIKRGETVGLVGRNGCGKSTLLQIICGTLQPSEGDVHVDGRIAALLELGAGFNGEFTGRENVYMNGAILGFGRDEMDARFEQITAFAGIGDFIERPVKTYSSGMFVRLAFAVATAVEPEILVVDEALAVGDEAFQRKCYGRIEAIKDRGGTVLFVSHSPSMVVQFCDRAVLLDGGEMLIEGEPRSVVKQYSRFINLAPEDQPAAREALKAIGRDGPVTEDGEPAHVSAKAATTTATDFTELEDFLDPGLVPANTVSYDERGGRISNLRVETLAGHPVNNLTADARYRVAYEVAFDVAASEVAFGFTITTTSGLELSAVGTSRVKEHRLRSVTPGTTVTVAFEFNARLLPGAYFLTAGVSGEIDEERQFLHRLIDGAMFRIQAMDDTLTLGFVSLGAKPVIKEIAAS